MFYRHAAPAHPAWNVAKTLVQTAIVWGLFLGMIPWAILRWQYAADFHWFFFPASHDLGLAVFLVGAVLGLWSRLTLTIVGQGTTLPFDAPRKLVVTGPYAWLRNPVAATMVGQGLGVAIWTGSTAVVIYLLAGGIFWHTVLRPIEEKDLQREFGREYEFYRRSTRCWLPMRRRFTPRHALAPITPMEEEERSAGRRRRRR